MTASPPAAVDARPPDLAGFRRAQQLAYTCAEAVAATLEPMLVALAGYRTLIVEMVAGGATQAQVYRAVEERAAAQGYQARHRAYPFGVLAHRVSTKRVRGHGVTLFGFGLSSIRTAVGNGGPRCDQPAQPGLWAVEPHLGREGVGAKFEELLVVTDGGAYWLDDDLPHVRRAQ